MGAGGMRVGRRQALWDLETIMTTFNNNFILRAHLEQAKEKLVARGEWWILAAMNAKGAKVDGGILLTGRAANLAAVGGEAHWGMGTARKGHVYSLCDNGLR